MFISRLRIQIAKCLYVSQGKLEVSGLFHDMVMELSRSLNFTPNFVVPNEEYYGKPQGHILALFSLITPYFFANVKAVQVLLLGDYFH